MGNKPTYNELLAENKKLKEVRNELSKANEKTKENERLLNQIAENFPNSYLAIIEKNFTVGFSSGQEFKRNNLNPKDFLGLTLKQVFGENTPFVKKTLSKNI